MKPYGMQFDGHQYVLNDGGKRCPKRIHLELKRVERRAARAVANDPREGCGRCGAAAQDGGRNDVLCACLPYDGYDGETYDGCSCDHCRAFFAGVAEVAERPRTSALKASVSELLGVNPWRLAWDALRRKIG
jgi:hypothetical protein